MPSCLYEDHGFPSCCARPARKLPCWTELMNMSDSFPCFWPSCLPDLLIHVATFQHLIVTLVIRKNYPLVVAKCQDQASICINALCIGVSMDTRDNIVYCVHRGHKLGVNSLLFLFLKYGWSYGFPKWLISNFSSHVPAGHPGKSSNLGSMMCEVLHQIGALIWWEIDHIKETCTYKMQSFTPYM